MDRLFNRFDGMYPTRWRASFPSEQAVKNWRAAWSIAFTEQHVTPKHIADGLKACATAFDWPPSITEFINLCKSPVEPESAYYEALQQMNIRSTNGKDQWSHPAIYWAAVKFGTWDLKSSVYSNAKTRWGATLDECLRDPETPVPSAMVALPAPGDTTPDAAKVMELLERAKKVIKPIDTGSRM
jgi:hypothetical protein